jgi:hypothetical protein
VYCDTHSSGTEDLIGFRSVYLYYYRVVCPQYKLNPGINPAQTPFVCRLMVTETESERCWDSAKIVHFPAERFALCLDGCQRGAGGTSNK